MPRIPIPEEMPKKYRKQYMANWLSVLYKEPFPYPNFKGKCVGCGFEGVIGSRKLTHRGMTTPTSLVCLKCNREGDDIHEQALHKTAPRKRLVKAKAATKVVGRRSRVV